MLGWVKRAFWQNMASSPFGMFNCDVEQTSLLFKTTLLKNKNKFFLSEWWLLSPFDGEIIRTCRNLFGIDILYCNFVLCFLVFFFNFFFRFCFTGKERCSVLKVKKCTSCFVKIKLNVYTRGLIVFTGKKMTKKKEIMFLTQTFSLITRHSR